MIGGNLTDQQELPCVSIQQEKVGTELLDGRAQTILPQQHRKLLQLLGAQLTAQLHRGQRSEAGGQKDIPTGTQRSEVKETVLEVVLP